MPLALPCAGRSPSGQPLTGRAGMRVIPGIATEIVVSAKSRDVALVASGRMSRYRDACVQAPGFADLQLFAAEATGIRQTGQSLGAQGFAGLRHHRLQLAGFIAVLHDILRDNQLASVLRRDLAVAAAHGPAGLLQRPRIRIDLRYPTLPACPQAFPQRLLVLAPFHQSLDLRRQFRILCAVRSILRSRIRLVQLPATLGNPLVQTLQALCRTCLRMDAVRIRIGLRKSPVDSHPAALRKRQLPAWRKELPAGCPQRRCIALAEIRDCPAARRGTPAQARSPPGSVASPLPAGANCAPGVDSHAGKLQQQSRIMGRLAGPAVFFRVPETQRLQIQRADERTDRAHRIAFGHIVVHAGRNKRQLASGRHLPATSLRHRGNPCGCPGCRRAWHLQAAKTRAQADRDGFIGARRQPGSPTSPSSAQRSAPFGVGKCFHSLRCAASSRNAAGSLPGPVHLRIAGVALVPGRRRRRDDGGVNDAALLQQNPPLGQVIPDLPNSWCASPRLSSRWRKSGSSSRPEPSQAPPRQSAGCSPPRKPVLHQRVAQVAERLNAVHAQHRRQRMRLSPLAAALRTRRRNAGLQALPGDQAVHPLRKDLAARLAIAFEAGKGQLPKALHVVIPQKKAVAQNSRRAPDAQ